VQVCGPLHFSHTSLSLHNSPWDDDVLLSQWLLITFLLPATPPRPTHTLRCQDVDMDVVDMAFQAYLQLNDYVTLHSPWETH
jgi:hypothetical protein